MKINKTKSEGYGLCNPCYNDKNIRAVYYLQANVKPDVRLTYRSKKRTQIQSDLNQVQQE